MLSGKKTNRHCEKEKIMYSWTEKYLNSVNNLEIISPEFYTKWRGKYLGNIIDTVSFPTRITSIQKPVVVRIWRN